MARPQFRTNKVSRIRLPQIQQKQFVESIINKGVITTTDATDIPSGALQQGKNVVVRYDVTSRRAGTILLVPAAPDAETVLKFSFMKLKDGSAYTLRFTPTTISSINSGAWDILAGTLVGSTSDRFRVVNILDKIIFTNNGANLIQLIDPAGLTWGDLGNAPAYRYVTGFYNRAVGAALRGTNEVQVGWSADGIATEWDPGVNPTAGFSPILESPSDLSDWITGIFGFTNYMILMREKSVWVATKNAVPTNPFNFVTAFAGIGCNVPNSIAVIPDGVAWLDTRTKTVWAYTPGRAPEAIGNAVKKNILKGFSDPSTIFASYNNEFAEYTLCIPRTGSTLVTTWTYNFDTKAWVEGEYDSISSLDDIELVVGDNNTIGQLTIDDLVGPIDSLVGTIDQLVASSSSLPDVMSNVRIFGRPNGDALIEDATQDTDAGVSFETLADSKIFFIPSDDIFVARLRLKVLKKMAGGMEIWWSSDGGVTFELWKTVPNSALTIGKQQLIDTFGPLKTREYTWRVRATEGSFDLLHMEIDVSETAKSQEP